jgi:hypothetical protein
MSAHNGAAGAGAPRAAPPLHLPQFLATAIDASKFPQGAIEPRTAKRNIQVAGGGRRGAGGPGPDCRAHGM